MRKIAKNGLYLEIKKTSTIDIPEGLSYEEALQYAHQQDFGGNLEYNLFINVLYEDGTIANEAGYEELK
jgi:hypothetical protein